MSLQLDERRLSMLAELGIRHFPLTRIEPAPEELLAESLAEKVGARPVALDTMQWAELEQAVAQAFDGRTGIVFGAGDTQAHWLIVGEPPDEDEAREGLPFAGQAGKLLDNMLRAIGLARGGNVYLTNVLKCRPLGNRNPEFAELLQCEAFLRRQVQLLRPKVILAMGRFAVHSLLGSTEPLGKLRGHRHEYLGVPVVVTYHPTALLRNPPDKAKAWADLCLAMEIAG